MRADPDGSTALHAAAALPDGGDVARLLLSLGSAAQAGWLHCQDRQGRTPADIAACSSCPHMMPFGMPGEEDLDSQALGSPLSSGWSSPRAAALASAASVPPGLGAARRLAGGTGVAVSPLVLAPARTLVGLRLLAAAVFALLVAVAVTTLRQ